MRIKNEYGLTVARLTPDEALGGAALGGLGVDLLRVADPRPEEYVSLEKAGYTVKPSWVSWLAPLTASEETFLAGLKANERRKLRRAQEYAGSAGLRLAMSHPLGARELDEFLGVYEKQVATMRNGLNLARGERDSILEKHASYVGIFAYDEQQRMMGGCLCWARPERSLLQLRYVATADVAQRGAITRAVYLAAFQAGRELGLEQMSLGHDTSLYGHVTAPGLYEFKKRLGFTPVPSAEVEPTMGGDEADLFVSLRSLTDPSLLLAYDATFTDGGRALKLRVLTAEGKEGTRTTPYEADFLTGVDVLTVP